MVIFHLLQNILQADLCLTGRTPKLLHLREQRPIFSMTRGNLIHVLKFDPVINSDAPLYESRFFIPFNAGVDIHDIMFSNLLIKLHSCIQKIY